MNTPLFTGIDTIIIRVSDVQISKNWYAQYLGFRFLFEDEAQKLIVMNIGGTTSLTLWETSETIQHRHATASYPILATADAEMTRTTFQTATSGYQPWRRMILHVASNSLTRMAICWKLVKYYKRKDWHSRATLQYTPNGKNNENIVT